MKVWLLSHKLVAQTWLAQWIETHTDEVLGVTFGTSCPIGSDGIRFSGWI